MYRLFCDCARRGLANIKLFFLLVCLLAALLSFTPPELPNTTTASHVLPPHDRPAQPQFADFSNLPALR